MKVLDERSADMLKYEEPKPISKEAVQKALSGSDEGTACEALVRAACTSNDRQWVEATLVSALSDGRVAVRKAALVALGDLVRVHHRIDLNVVIPLLGNFLRDPVLYGTATDTLAEIATFFTQEKSQAP
jgi:hypothetical protein